MSTVSQNLPAAETSRQISVVEVALRARRASRGLASLPHEQRNEVLLAVAAAIEAAAGEIIRANERDCQAAEPAVAAGKMSSAMLARLRLNEKGVQDMATRVRDVARLPDPLGRRLTATELDDGLTLYKESCPLGVVAIIFEARPEVVSQVASLTLKSGNAAILKGGSEAANSNEVIATVWREALSHFPEVPQDAVQLLHTRADVMELLSLDRDVDLIIPRGSRELVEFVSRTSKIPVLGHGEGICHVYVDRDADLQKAVRVTVDSKVQGPAICNAAETLLVDQEIAAQFLPMVAERLRAAGVELRGCPLTLALLEGQQGILQATGKDWSTEYCDLILSIKVVADVTDAIEHINRYGSRHTDTIVTENPAAAKTFMDEVDSAGVFQNASTRFADGFRYGLGAELGVSNSKLHARGPMGLDGLTTYKYKLFGSGHTVAEYASGQRRFTHRPL